MSFKQEEDHLEKVNNDFANRPPSLGGSVQEADVEPDLHWRSWIVVAACGFYYAATLIVLVSTGFWIGVISKDIGGAALGLWLSQSYQVMNSVLGPIFGQVGDSCGRRYLMIVCLTLGWVGCVIIATAKSMNIAILGTVIYGFDWCLVGNAFSIASEVTTRRWRPRAQSFMNVCGSVGIIFGVFCGAGFILHSEPAGKHAGWRDCFYLAAGMIAAADLMFILFYHPAPAPNPLNLTVPQRIMKCDLVGGVLLAFGLTPLLLGLIWGGQTAPWKSAQVLAPLITGCFFTIVFALHQIFIKKDGLFNHAMFKNKNVAVAIFGMGVEGMVYVTFNQYYGEVTGILYEARTLLLATRFSVFLFANITGSIFVQWYSYKFKRVKELLVGGYFLFLVGMIGMATLKANDPIMSKLVIAWAAIAGFGFSAPIALLISTAQLAVEAQYIGLVSGLLISARSVFGAVGVAIATAVWTNKLGTALPNFIAEAGLKAGLPASSLPAFVGGLASGNVTLAMSAPGVTLAIVEAGGAAALDAYAFSLKYIWIVIIPFVVVAMLICLLLGDVKDQMNYLVDRPSEAIHHHDHVEGGHAHAAEL